jgi:glycosyltransferase involved in cell wall biosynthesis
MKITHFLIGRCNPDSANGVEKTVFNLVKSQAALGNVVTLLSLTAKPPIPIPGVAVRCHPPGKFRFSLPKSLITDLLETQPDVVHLHSVYTPQNIVIARELRRRNIPYVVTPNGGLSPYVTRRRWYLKYPYKLLFELPFQNQAAFVHAVSDMDADHTKHYGVRTPVVKIPNGIDPATIPNQLDRTLLVKRFPQLQGKRIFLYLGRLDFHGKGLDLLLSGFSLAGLDNIALVLVGPDWRDGCKTVEDWVQRLGIKSQVIMTGAAFGSEKCGFLAGADVFVSISRSEGMSFSVLEAAALGMPCMLTPAADPMMEMSRNQGSVSVQLTSESVAQGLRAMTALSTDELQAMGTRAQQTVESEFNWEKIATNLVKAYQTYATPKR